MDRGSSTFQNFFNMPTDPFSLNSNSLWSIYADINQNIWIGTFNGGINVVKKEASKFKHYRHIPGVNSLSSNKVLSIFEDSEQNLRIGIDGGGINVYNGREKTFTHLKHELANHNSICGDYVLKVFEDSQGNIWVETWQDGLTIINRKKMLIHIINMSLTTPLV